MAARIGVLALQGAFARHGDMLERCGASPVEVRQPKHLAGLDALVLPGGESTTMSKLLTTFGLFDPIAKHLVDGMPAFGTCAGMILMAREVLDGRADQRSFGAIDISVKRNGYGRQVDSFERNLDFAPGFTLEYPNPDAEAPLVGSAPMSASAPVGLGAVEVSANAPVGLGRAEVAANGPFLGVFIRAPLTVDVGDGVEVLATVEGQPVLCRQGNVMVCSFHPELTDDNRLHRLFLRNT